MKYHLKVELLTDGVFVNYSPVAKEHLSKVSEKFEKMYEDLAGSAVGSYPVEGQPQCVNYEHIASTVCGIPVPVTPAQAEAIKHMKFEHGKEIGVLEIDGGHYILSDSGSRRVLANVRARYVIAKRLNCVPKIEGGCVQWHGKIAVECDD